MTPHRSLYPRQGRVELAEDHLLIGQAPADRYDALERAIRARHPRELPEIIAVRVEAVLPTRLEWVAAETRPTA